MRLSAARVPNAMAAFSASPPHWRGVPGDGGSGQACAPSSTASARSSGDALTTIAPASAGQASVASTVPLKTRLASAARSVADRAGARRVLAASGLLAGIMAQMLIGE